MGLGSFVGNLTGGLIGTSDAEKAADAAKALSAEARREILGELDTSWGDIRGYLEPWLKEGQSALDKYKQAIGAQPDAPVFEGFTPDVKAFSGFDPTAGEFEFDSSKIAQNPAYQFVLDQAMQQVDRTAAASRGLRSGNRMTAIADYAGGLASQEYGNEFNRQLQTYGTNLARERDIYGTEQDAISRNLSRQRDVYGTGEEAKSGNFAARNLLSNQRISNLGNLTTMGQNTANNLASLRDRLSGSRAGAWSNYAAEQTAANLIPAQEKQSFINNAIGTAGMYFGMRDR